MTDTDPYVMISRRQAETLPHAALAEHAPQMLYFGCIDARLDPIGDLGMEKGRLLIFRNIAALVPKFEPSAATPGAGALSTGAALEFFLRHIPFKAGRTKHIVVSGHTDCGGLKACRDNAGREDRCLPLYLESLKDVRRRVMAAAETNGWNAGETLHALEEESVRQSVAYLKTYPVVEESLVRGELHIHGWVLDTATSGIAEMDAATGQFARMAMKGPLPAPGGSGT